MKIKRKIFGYLKGIARAGFMAYVMLAIFGTGEIYGRYSDPGEGTIEFFMQKTQYEWASLDSPPPILLEQMEAYNVTVGHIWKALLFMAFVFFFDYFVDPKNHFITMLKNRAKRVGDKLEDE